MLLHESLRALRNLLLALAAGVLCWVAIGALGWMVYTFVVLTVGTIRG